MVWYFGGLETRKGSRREFRFGRTMNTGCLVDGLLYTVELNGYLFCINAATGRKCWHHDVKSDVWGSATYADGKVFVATGNGEFFIYRHVADQVEGLDEDDYPEREKQREIRRRVEEKYLIRSINFDDAIRTAPVVANGTLFVQTERTLFAIAFDAEMD